MLRRYLLFGLFSFSFLVSFAQGWVPYQTFDTPGEGFVPEEAALNEHYFVITNPSDSIGFEEDEVLEHAGSAVIFKRLSNGSLTLHQRVVPSVRQEQGLFGSAVCISDSLLWISSRREDVEIDDETYDDLGVVYLFRLNQNGFWEEAQRILPQVFNSQTLFGSSMVFENNQLIVGSAFLSAPLNGFEGAVYVYDLNEDDEYQLSQSIVPSSEPFSDFYEPGTAFGTTLALDSNLLAIGAYGTDYFDELSQSYISNAGAVYIYGKTELGNWEFKQVLLNQYPSNYNEFGSALAIGNGQIFVKTGDINENTISVYKEVEGTFEVIQSIETELTNLFEKKGLIISENKLVVSTSFSIDDVNAFGQIEIYESHEGTEIWSLVQSISEPPGMISESPGITNRYGISFDFDQEQLFVGSYTRFFNSENIIDSTKARIFIYETCETQSISLEIDACDTYTSPSGLVFNQSETFVDSVELNESCFDIYDINLQMEYSSEALKFRTACGEFQSFSGNYTWTESGTYLDTIPNTVGCDSVLTVILLLENDSTFINTQACDSLFWQDNGETYYESGIYTAVLENEHGCDSLVSLDLQINQAEYLEQTMDVCGPYLSPSGNYSWSDSGTYQDTTYNANGCAVYHTMDLTIEESPYDSLTVQACDGYQSPSNNYFWTESGQYLDTMPSVLNCDSLIYINLEVLSSTYSEVDTSNCMGINSPFGDEYWGESGDYVVIIPNTQGCDSVITFDLDVPEPETNVLVMGNDSLFSTAYGASFIQWVDCENGFSIVEGATDQGFSPEESGTYAAVVTEFGCTDTSACKTITITSTNEAENLAFTIYPNPGRGQFNITVSDYIENGVLNLYDSQGRLVYSTPLKQTQEMRFEPRVENGTYILKLMRDDMVLGETRLVILK